MTPRRFSSFGLLALLSLVGCATAPTKDELANLDYGSCPTQYRAIVEEHLSNHMLVFYDGKPIIWAPNKFWHKGGMAGSHMNAGYLVVAMANQTGGSPLTAGKQLYGFLFHGEELVEQLDPGTLATFPLSGALGPLPTDDRNWTLGNSQSAQGQSIDEFVPPGETVQDWSELITLQSFGRNNFNVRPAQLAQTTADLSRKNCSDVAFDLLRESPTEALFYRRTIKCAPMRDEYTVGKVILTPRNMAIVSYAKTTAMSDTDRQKWTRIVDETKLMSDCD